MPDIRFLDLNKFKKNLMPVTSSQILTRTESFHPNGLFSEIIFGPIGSMERDRTFSYIDLNCQVIHPRALKILARLDRKILDFVSVKNTFSLNKEGELIEDENGTAGIQEFKRIFPQIKFREDTSERKSLINLIKESYNDKRLFVDIVPVIPPNQRPAYKDEEKNEFTYDPLNDYYLTIIKRAANIKSIGGFGPIFDIINADIQNSVNELMNFVEAKIGKKFGIIRNQILGKRVEFSGRAGITSGPTLKNDQIGLPLRLAANLFEPFIINILTKNPNYIDNEELNSLIKSYTGNTKSIESIKRVIKAIKNDDKIPERLFEIFFEATELASKNRVVVAKRDPVLHRESIRCFYPVIIRENSIEIATTQVGGFNADFDGDQMAIFHPITNEAQNEVKSKMFTVNTGNTPTINFELTKDMCVGIYMLTKPMNPTNSPMTYTKDDFDRATNPYVSVIYNGRRTTMGKALVNSCFPQGFRFIDDQLNKGKLNGLIKETFEKYGNQEAKDTADRLKTLGFKFATILAPSIIIDNLVLPDEIAKLKKNIEEKPLEEQIKILDHVNKLMQDNLKGSGLFDLVDSGATKGWEQPQQMITSKGIMADPEGNVLPAIESSLGEGLSPKDYFKATAGARKGIIDRVLNTADTGYTTRQLVFLLNSVEIHPNLIDCGTKKYLELKLDSDLIKRLIGRFVIVNGKIEEFDPKNAKIGQMIKLRTPLYCISPKLCHTCYGRLLEKHRTPFGGILAAQQVGERGTQLIMRSFHKGGAVSLSVRNIIDDVLEGDPLITLTK